MSTLKLIRTFVAVAEYGSFSAAAERIALTPAAVGLQMRALETELKRTLFNRGRRTISLTPEAVSLLPHARQLMVEYGRMVNQRTDPETIAGAIEIGAIISTMGILTTTIIKMKTTYPALDVRLVLGRSPELVQAVQTGEMDAAVIVETPGLPHDNAYWTRLYEEPLMLIASRRVAALHADARTLLQTQPFIRFDRRSLSGTKIDQLLHKNHIVPNEILEVNSLAAIVDLVRQNAGVAIVPVLKHSGWATDPALAILPLPGPRFVRHIGMIENRDRTHITSVVREALYGAQGD